MIKPIKKSSMEKQTAISNGFESWAILELLGHLKYAGKVDEVEVAGSKMIRITVPAIEANGGLPEFQKIFGTSSVYAMTPVSEAYAKETAEQLRKHPIEGYEHQAVITKMAKAYAENITLKEVKKLFTNGTLISDGEIEEKDFPFDE